MQAAYKVWGRSAGEDILNEDAPRACNPLSLFSQQHGSNKDVLQQQRASQKILSLNFLRLWIRVQPLRAAQPAYLISLAQIFIRPQSLRGYAAFTNPRFAARSILSLSAPGPCANIMLLCAVMRACDIHTRSALCKKTHTHTYATSPFII